jgi:segregation and condensation protein B
MTAIAEPAAPLADVRLVAQVEALFFAAGRVVTVDELAAATGQDTSALVEAVARLESSLAERGVMLLHLAGGYRLATRPEHAEAVRALLKPSAVRLSPARLETLAVVAWRQPVTRAEIEAIRGVDCSATLKALLEVDLVDLRGRRHDKPGKPLQYGTGQRFLEEFGLRGLDDLPRLEELES